MHISLVYFGSLDSYFYAVDSSTGQERWRFKTEDRIVSSPAIADGFSPTIADGVVYFSSDDGNLYAVDITTSQERWRFTVEEGSLSSPALVDGMVYFGKLMCI